MQVELSKREIEVILEFMDLGIAFLISHGQLSKKLDNKKQKISVRELMEKLKETKNG